MQDLKNQTHHSFYVSEVEYDVLILRGLDINHEHGLSYISKGLVISKDLEVYTYEHDRSLLEKHEKTYQELASIISPIYERNQKIIDNYVDEIDQLEDSLFERRASRIFMDIWFDLKKDLSRIERHLERNYSVFQNFLKAHKKNAEFPEAEVRDILDRIHSSGQQASNQLARLDALYNYYVSIKNDRLNRNIFLLTVLSAVFLPLNLIVGFFGMNTEGLFFKDNAMGTQYVMMIVLGSLVVSIFGLPVIKLVDHYILKFFLGRYDIYKKISGRIDQIFKIE